MKMFKRVVIDEGIDGRSPLLIRYIIFRCKSWGLFVHHFMRSDYDRYLHDHPWPFVSLILKGGYREVHDQTKDLSQTTQDVQPGQILVRPAEWRHRVILRPGQTSWSLVLVGRRTNIWGFFTAEGWCYWRKYDALRGICSETDIHTGGND